MPNFPRFFQYLFQYLFQPFISRSIVLLLLPLLPVSALAIPIIDMLEAEGSPQAILPVSLAGRDHAAEFTGVAELINRGDATALVVLADGVLADSPESDLALEIRGLGHMLRGDFLAAMSDLEAAARLNPDNADMLSKLGLARMEADRLDAARSAFQLALTVNPQHAFSQRNLGLLLDHLGEEDEAIRQLALGLANAPSGHVFEASVLARLLTEREGYELAIGVLEPRLVLDSTNEQAQLILATALLRAERWEGAVSRFQQVLRLDENNAPARLGLATALRGAGRPQEAIASLQIMESNGRFENNVAVELSLALQAAGDDQQATNYRQQALTAGADQNALDELVAQQYVRNERFNEAFETYQALIARDGGSPQAYASYSELMIAGGLDSDARELLRSARQKFPGNAYLAYRLGNLLASFSDYQGALREFGEANTLAPNTYNILRGMSLVQTRLGQHPDAATSAEQALMLYPQDLDSLIFAALAQERAGDNDAAISRYLTALDVQPGNALVLNNLANIYLERDALDDAQQAAEQAVAAAGNNALILDTLGKVYLAQGELQDALDVLTRATAIEPPAGVAFYRLGLTYAALGQEAEARTALEQALSLSPNATWAEDAKTQLEDL